MYICSFYGYNKPIDYIEDLYENKYDLFCYSGCSTFGNDIKENPVREWSHINLFPQ